MPEFNKEIKAKEASRDCGVFIDIDGVVLQGGKPFPYSKESIHKLWNNNVPFAFLTNGTYTSATITKSLTSILDLPFNKDHFIVAPSPCQALTEYHDKNVLVCCQDDAIDLISELGFKSYITIPQLSKLFPDLDYVDHNHRIVLNKNPPNAELKKQQAEFKPIEAILLLGEPINWECHLQLLLDILMLNGDPRSEFKFLPKPHLPIIACNKDITFKGAAQLPRFGHGAFLECLENLYNKVTNNELKYEVMMGKPCVVTYEFAAMQIQKQARNNKEIKKFFIIGDNPDVDVRGANYFKQHLNILESKSTKMNILNETSDSKDKQKGNAVESILVSTGVYNPQNDIQVHLKKLFEKSHAHHENEKTELKNALSQHNTFVNYFENKQNVPDVIVDNLSGAVDYILKSI